MDGEPIEDLGSLRQQLATIEDPIALLEGLFASAPVGLQIYRSDGRSLLVNRAFRELFGAVPPPEYNVLRDEIAAREGVLDLIHRAFAGETVKVPPIWYDPRELTQVHVAQANRVAFESTFFPLFGRDGQVTHIAITFRDVTNELRAREQLEGSERRFRALVENSTDAIELLAQDGTVLYVSPAATRILGVELEQQVGLSVFDRVHPDDLEAARRSFEQSLRTPDTVIQCHVRRRHADGSFRHLELVRVNRLADPAIRAIVNNYRDVTERLVLEEQFLQSQKMEAIGRLAGGVAHDFNNLLTAILSYAGFALDELRQDDPMRDDMLEIQRAAERAVTLTRQLLAFSRRQVLAPRVTNLNDVVRDMQRMLGRVIREDIELSVELAENLAPTKIDSSQIEQVILNLVVNARDALPRGGKISIETANVVLDAEYERQHAGVDPGRYCMLVISDSGTGMTRSVRERIFEPFFTTKEPGHGTGLGLATVFGIVKQSGGHIWVYSEPGQGAVFRLYFPQTDESPCDPPQRARPSPLWSGEEVVLLAEDEAAVRDIAKKVLQRAGYTVLSAENGGEALLIAEQHPGEIHVLLTDAVMPRMSGRALAERLLALRPRLKVMYMSGYAEDAVAHNGVLQPGSEFIEKPLTPELLLRKLRQLLDR